MTHKRHAKPKRTAATLLPPIPGGRLWSLRALAAGAMLISGYLLWGSFSGDHLPGCGPESDCDAVLNSRWSYWLGMPVSLGALATYALALGLTVPLARPGSVEARQRCLNLLLGLALVILGAAIWFVALQVFAIRAICPYCMTAHGFGIALAVLVFWLAREAHGSPGGRAAPRVQRADRRGFGHPAFGSAVALAILVAGQVLYRPPTFRVQRGEEAPGSKSGEGGREATNPLASQTGGSRTNGGPFLDLHAGAFRLNLGEVPLLGRPEAPHVMVSLFDYTCAHCRVAHPSLVETQRALGDQLAIVSLPVPFDRTCNPTVRRQLPAHTNACVYARLGLAVWRANRAQSSAFDDWLFATPTPPTTQQAVERARQLVGTNALAAALNDRWIDELLGQSVQLHRTNELRYGKSQLPQLMMGPDLAVGSFDSTPILLGVVCQQFGLAVPDR